MKPDPDLLVMGWTEGQRQWLLNGHRSSFFSHRTDPKPRPEGYRDYSEEGTIGQETIGMIERGMFDPECGLYDPIHDAQKAARAAQEGPSESLRGSGQHPHDQKAS